jgi:hypothetical protein
MIIEMRTYKTRPGCRAKFLEVFQTKSIPAHAEIGMKIIGPFLSLEDPDTFFCLLSRICGVTLVLGGGPSCDRGQFP